MLPDQQFERGPETIKMVYDAFLEYARLLRTWLVAFGIGGPILFLNIQGVYDTLRASDDRWLLLSVFFAGLGLQVLSALLHKWVAWFVVVGAVSERVRRLPLYRFSIFMANFPWIGVIADVGTVVLFAYAAALSVHLLI